MKSSRLPQRAALSALTLLLFAGCETHPDVKAMKEEARHSVPLMVARENFFDGAVVAHLSVGGTGDDEVGVDDDSRGHVDSGLHGIATGFGSTSGDNFAGSAGGDGVPEHESKSQMHGEYKGNPGMGGVTYDEGPQIRRRESEMPGAVLRLRLENKSLATVVVEIRQMNSDLGNFAVRPDTVTLAPGQSVEPDPMESLLGLDTYSLPVTVTLREGGLTETKILTLRPKTPAAPATPPAPVPPAAH